MRIAIVGMGMAGASAAAALARRGCRAEVFEQAGEIREVGAGIGLWANAIRLLLRLGLAEDLERVGTRTVEPRLCNPGGELLFSFDVDSFDGVPGYCIHRAELLAAIVGRVPADCVHLDKRCIAAVESEDHVRLDFADGTSSEFDLVIGADGVKSLLVNAVVADPPPLEFAHLAAYRGLAPNLPEIDLRQPRIWTDRTKYVIVFPVSGRSRINIAAFVPTDERPDSSWFASGDLAALKAEFAGWDPDLQRVIEAMPETFRWGLYHRAPLARMAGRRIALAGDAAHAMTPHAGMGAGQGIEDGFALAALVADATADEVPERLRLYESLRLPYTAAVQEMTRRNIQFMHASVPLRAGEVRPERTAPTQALIDYDVEREAERLLELC